MPDLQRRASDTISVTFDPKICVHAARCLQGLPGVFDLQQRPWIQPQNASPDDVAEVVMRCPSGALQFERLDGGPAEPVPAETTVVALANGPLLVRGDLHFTTRDGETVRTTTRATLCRCGGSSNKPFCDASHRTNGFEADWVELDLKQIPVVHNDSHNRFEIRHGADTAILTYVRDGQVIEYTHTIVPHALEGHGIAAKLATFALDYARANNLSVIPSCPYVSAFVLRHIEYHDLVE
jgi:uncharacterized Fe-S cluster protein YjdI/predicted GNAT family acetyltransferase